MSRGLAAIIEEARRRIFAENPCPICRGFGFFGDVDETTTDVAERWCSCIVGRLRATIENGAPLMIENPETTATTEEMPEGVVAVGPEPAPVPVTADTLRADASNEGLRLPSRASLAALVPRAFDTDVDAVRFAISTARVLGEELGAVAEPAAVLAEITREQTDAEICAAFDAAWADADDGIALTVSDSATLAEANHRAALAVAKLVRRERGVS